MESSWFLLSVSTDVTDIILNSRFNFRLLACVLRVWMLVWVLDLKQDFIRVSVTHNYACGLEVYDY